MAEREGHEKIRLSIPEKVRELMEERLILEEDIRQVISYVERTGNRLLNQATNRCLAHHKSASVTYWVEYSRNEDTFVIHNTYSHRMEIVEDMKL